MEIIEDYQEKLCIKGIEINAMKTTVEELKNKNSDLHKIKRDLNEKLDETEILLTSAKSNVELLEKERESYNESSRNLEESLKVLKFELYELNKEREKFNEPENQQLNLPCFVSNKSDETKSDRYERCKQRMPLSDIQIDARHDNVTKLQKEYIKLRRKYDHVKNLCIIRNKKISDLEKQIQNFKTQ